jgi:hypothetical protein
MTCALEVAAVVRNAQSDFPFVHWAAQRCDRGRDLLVLQRAVILQQVTPSAIAERVTKRALRSLDDLPSVVGVCRRHD